MTSLLLALICFTATDTLTGKVVRIADGDTVTGEQVRLRLFGIDAPVRGQDYSRTLLQVVHSNEGFANMDELKLLRKQVEQIREETVKCPSCMDLWSVLAYDKVLHAIDEMTKKESAAR